MKDKTSFYTFLAYFPFTHQNAGCIGVWRRYVSNPHDVLFYSLLHAPWTLITKCARTVRHKITHTLVYAQMKKSGASVRLRKWLWTWFSPSSSKSRGEPLFMSFMRLASQLGTFVCVYGKLKYDIRSVVQYVHSPGAAFFGGRAMKINSISHLNATCG